MIILAVQDIQKSFGTHEVLKSVSFTLQEQERMGLVGVNGSGKSTLLKLIAGQMEPDEGTVSLMKGTTMGFLSQHADIRTDLNVYEELSRVLDRKSVV